VDLFRSIDCRGTILYTRGKQERMGVIFVFTVTFAIYVEFVESYSTDSLLVTFRRFMRLRGTSMQPVVASKQTGMKDLMGSFSE
jgi:hypothetical protein